MFRNVWQLCCRQNSAQHQCVRNWDGRRVGYRRPDIRQVPIRWCICCDSPLCPYWSAWNKTKQHHLPRIFLVPVKMLPVVDRSRPTSRWVSSSTRTTISSGQRATKESGPPSGSWQAGSMVGSKGWYRSTWRFASEEWWRKPPQVHWIQFHDLWCLLALHHKEVFSWGLLSEGLEASVDVLLHSGAL